MLLGHVPHISPGQCAGTVPLLPLAVVSSSHVLSRPIDVALMALGGCGSAPCGLFVPLLVLFRCVTSYILSEDVTLVPM